MPKSIIAGPLTKSEINFDIRLYGNWLAVLSGRRKLPLFDLFHRSFVQAMIK